MASVARKERRPHGTLSQQIKSHGTLRFVRLGAAFAEDDR